MTDQTRQIDQTRPLQSCCAVAIKLGGIKCPVCQRELAQRCMRPFGHAGECAAELDPGTTVGSCPRLLAEVLPPFYVTTFCNRAHRLQTGRPIGHECYVLPPSALKAERAGDMDGAIAILQRLGKGPIVKGRR